MYKGSKMLLRLFERDGPQCWYCGDSLAHPSEMVPSSKRGYFRAPEGKVFPTIDHLQPRSRCGANADVNCVLSCSTCNNRKGPKSLDEYRQWLVKITGGNTHIVFAGERPAPSAAGGS